MLAEHSDVVSHSVGEQLGHSRSRAREDDMLKRANAGVLDVAYEETGAPDGAPIVLLHGFPYDVHAFDEVTPLLTARGCRVLTPYLRGYGPTRFLAEAAPRSGQQAALGHDLL